MNTIKWMDSTISIPANPIISLNEIMVFLDTPEETIRRWVKEGKFPSPIPREKHDQWASRAFGVWLAWQMHRPIPDDQEECAKQDAELAKADAGSWVYFIRGGERVKIGIAAIVEKRMASLQTATPEPLELLHAIRGDRQDERKLHRRFAAHRIRGEWFHLVDEIKCYIDRLKGR